MEEEVKSILRDYTAFDRTIMANQRTLLSYIRTFLMLLISGVTVSKLFPGDTFAIVCGIFFTISGVIMLSFGSYFYLREDKAVRRIYAERYNENI